MKPQQIIRALILLGAIALMLLLTSCSGTGHTTQSSSCPAYSINETNSHDTCEV
jgi:hypothetical protein